MLPRDVAEVTPLPAKPEITVCRNVGIADDLYLGYTARFEHAAGLGNCLSRVILAEMLQDV